MMRWMLVLGITGVAAVAAPLEAQGRGNGRGRDGAGVPPGQRPAAGQCRIWIDGVPPGRQPAPTDCATAERDRPANGRVIYGDDVRDGKGKAKGKKAKNDRRDRDEDTDDRKRRDRDEDTDDRKRRDRDGDTDDRRDRADRRDRDGRGRDTCVDRNRDGRCDVRPRTGTGGIGGYPRTLPMMVNAAVLESGNRSREASIWLRGVAARGAYVDGDGNKIPESINWIGRDGQVIQVWYDDDRSGRADRVEIYQDGRLIGTRR